MTTTIVKRFTFEAAHQLPNHKGHCRRLHGHSYVVEVAIRGTVNEIRGESDDGMVVDFGDVAAAFKERIHDRLDHQYLNDVLDPMLTTAENLARWIMGQLAPVLEVIHPEPHQMMLHLPHPENRVVEFVRVWETATGYAQASRYR